MCVCLGYWKVCKGHWRPSEYLCDLGMNTRSPHSYMQIRLNMTSIDKEYKLQTIQSRLPGLCHSESLS